MNNKKLQRQPLKTQNWKVQRPDVIHGLGLFCSATVTVSTCFTSRKIIQRMTHTAEEHQY